MKTRPLVTDPVPLVGPWFNVFLNLCPQFANRPDKEAMMVSPGEKLGERIRERRKRPSDRLADREGRPRSQGLGTGQDRPGPLPERE